MMLKHTRQQTRVLYQGEVFFIVGLGEAQIPPLEGFTEPIYIPTFILTKVETASHLKTPIKALEVFMYEVTPLASEIQLWLGGIDNLARDK